MPCTTQKSGVVVAIDGSEESNAAVRWATQEAAMRRDSLTIVSVVNREYLYIRDPETQDRVRNGSGNMPKTCFAGLRRPSRIRMSPPRFRR